MENTENIQVNKEEYEKLVSTVKQLENKVEQIENEQNSKIEKLQNDIQTLTTWKSIDTNISLPTVEWDSNSATFEELKGAKKVALFDTTNSSVIYIENLNNGRTQRVWYTNGIPDEYKFSAFVDIDFYTGKVYFITVRIGYNVKNEAGYLPVITKIYYMY